MDLTATIAAVPFRYVRSTRARLPGIPMRPLGNGAGEPLFLAEDSGYRFILIDHRCGLRSAVVSRVEFWRPAGPVEARLDGLLVIADAMTSAGARTFATLADLVQALAVETLPAAR